MLRIHYFASVRERMGRESECLAHPTGVATVTDLIRHLRERDKVFARMVVAEERVLAAVNQSVASRDQAVRDGDEIAFFPPMSGG